MNMLDVMTRDVIRIHESDNLASALSIMNEAKTHHLVVCSQSGKVIGILSDRDCRLAAQSPFSEGNSQLLAKSIPISLIMTAMPQCLSPHVSVGEAAQIMLNYQIHALPVVHDDRLIGIVTSTDLLKLLVGQEL
jgi:CBS domain-containing protein